MYSENYIPFDDDIKSKLEISTAFNEQYNTQNNESENREINKNKIINDDIDAYYTYAYNNKKKSMAILQKFKEKKMMIEENKNRAEENIKLENLNNINL
jgi:hypothetical protein